MGRKQARHRILAREIKGERMTYNEVKKLLSTYLSKLKLLKIKKEQLAEKRQEMGEIGAIDYSKVNVQSGAKTSLQERFIIVIEKYEQEYERLMLELFDVEDKIAEFLPLLDETEQSLIIERYMKAKPMSVIAREFHYSYDWLKHKYYGMYKKIAKATKK